MALVINIIEDILDRERDLKVKVQVLPLLLQNKPLEVREEVLPLAYNRTEQCARLLAKRLGQSIEISVSKDPGTNEIYNEKIAAWLDEHPFLNDGKIENSVFESYVLSALIDNGNYNELVQEYLERFYKGAFMLFFIYNQIKRSNSINFKHLPYLYDSVKSLDSTQFRSFLSIDADDFEEEGKSQVCDVEIRIVTPHDDQFFTYNTLISPEDVLELKGTLNGLYVYAPITIRLTGVKLILGAPADIRCKKLLVSSKEISLEKGLLDNVMLNRAFLPKAESYVVDLGNSPNDIILDCQTFDVDYAQASDPRIVSYLGDSQKFIIFCTNRPPHPFGLYHDAKGCTYISDEQTREKYLRFRRLVTTLRSHSKGVLARYKDKILHRRILKNEIGENILSALIARGILYSDEKFFYWDPEAANEYLGIDYKGITQMKSTIKLDQFLENI